MLFYKIPKNSLKVFPSVVRQTVRWGPHTSSYDWGRPTALLSCSPPWQSTTEIDGHKCASINYFIYLLFCEYFLSNFREEKGVGLKTPVFLSLSDFFYVNTSTRHSDSSWVEWKFSNVTLFWSQLSTTLYIPLPYLTIRDC